MTLNSIAILSSDPVDNCSVIYMSLLSPLNTRPFDLEKIYPEIIINIIKEI